MEALKKYSDDLQKKITIGYGELIRACSDEYDATGMKLIRQSVDFLLEYTPEEEQKLGMHLGLFALGLAEMTVKELGLDALGISAVLISDAVEQNKIPLEDVKAKLGERTGQIIEELLKISDLDTSTNSSQAENMRNLILTLAMAWLAFSVLFPNVI